YHFSGKDKAGCLVDPTASIDAPARLCLFAACSQGYTELKGCSKGAEVEEMNAGATPGCCVAGPGAKVQIDYKCHHPFNFDDSSDVYLRVDHAPSSSCTAYTVKYH